MTRLRGPLSLLAVLACALVVVADAQDEVRKLLIGRWEVKRKVGEEELSGDLSFSADGKATMKVRRPEKGDIVFSGSYKLLSPTKIEITFTVLGNSMSEEHEVKVTQDTLELTDKKMMVQRMKRLK